MPAAGHPVTVLRLPALAAVLGMALAWMGLAWTAGAGLRAETLTADLSEHEIKITTGFAGTELLLFGVTPGTGDVMVIVSGPDGSVIVRRKSRVSGVWINADSIRFDTVPGFYYVAATDGLRATDLEEVLRENGVGFRYQNLSPASVIGPALSGTYREALLRRKQAKHLYTAEAGKIDILGKMLFRTRVPFPANVPTGRYRVDVYHVIDGWVSSTTTIPLTVNKVGMEASIFRFAHDRPALYGVVAILIAGLAGYGAGMLFGRR
jgi:uncharacterized protein (TIGR02186 family)